MTVRPTPQTQSHAERTPHSTPPHERRNEHGFPEHGPRDTTRAPTTSVDQARLLPRYRQGVNTPSSSHTTSSTQTPALSQRTYTASAGGDHIRLRGIPAIGRGVAGAIPHTNPLTETIHRNTPRNQ